MATRTINGGIGAGALTCNAVPMVSGLGGSADLLSSSLNYVEVTIPSASVLTLRATPVTIVAAPGASNVVLPVYGGIFLTYNSVAYTESTANLALKWTNGSGAQVSQTVEMTGFIDQTASMTTNIMGKIDCIAAQASASVNQPLVLHNLGAAEFGNSGNSALVVKLWYVNLTVT